MTTPSSAISVGEVQSSEHAAWDQFVDAHPQGNIYHSLAWKSVTEEAFGHTPHYLRALDDAGRIVALLPLFLVKGVFGRRLVSMPMRDRGGLLSADAGAAAQVLAHAVALTKELGCRYLELKSLEEFDASLLKRFGLVTRRQWVTTRIDLSPGSAALWKALDRDGVRWAIRKVKREGVTFEFDNSKEGINLFHTMFVTTRLAMGIPPFPKALFDALWRELICSGRANLAFVRAQSRPIHGMISLLSKDTFIPAYAAPQNAWRKCYPSDVMFWDTIEWAAQQGMHWYDFGADSSRQAGLLKFKKKWGGVPHPMTYAYFLNGASAPSDFDSTRPVYAIAREAWKRLPRVVGAPLGGWVTRQLS